MTVISCKQEFQSRQYNANEKRQEKMPLTWFIETDDKDDGPLTIIPQAQRFDLWGPHRLVTQYDPYQCGNDHSEFLLARTIDLNQVSGSNTAWRAKVEFDNSFDPGQSAQNPLERLPIDDWDFDQFQRAIEKDIENKPIVNPCGEPFDPPLQIDDSRPILTYTRNEATFPQQILNYQDAINADGFLIFDPGTAKISIRAGKKFEGEYKYYEVKYTFHFRWDGWKREGLNRGHKFKLSAGDTKYVTLPPGEKPVLLAENGTITTSDNPSYTKVKVYRELPFASLNIYIV